MTEKARIIDQLNEAEFILANTKELNRSAWYRGVRAYAFDLIEDLKERVEADWITAADLDNHLSVHKALLNGAWDWKEYSEDGCSLIYDGIIAKRLCTPSELKRTQNGLKEPNARESWIDVQTRALHQAECVLMVAFKKAYIF